jgi:hypothetical protein
MASIWEHPRHPAWSLAHTACEGNDTTLMTQALATLSKVYETQSLYDYWLQEAIRHDAANVVKQLIERGVDVKHIRPPFVACKTKYRIRWSSTEILELLVANGWDINTRSRGLCGRDAEPYIWRVVGNIDLVRWCLEHGANVQFKDYDPPPDLRRERCLVPFTPILDRAAESSSIETFELLRSHGAPLGWRTLHSAIQAATHYAPKEDHTERLEEEKKDPEYVEEKKDSEDVEEKKVSEDVEEKKDSKDVEEKKDPEDVEEKKDPECVEEKKDSEDVEEKKDPEYAEMYAERIAMVHYLLDVVKLDVNAPDQPAGRNAVMHNGTPICYIPGSDITDTDTRELTWLLLDRGADPTPALVVAEQSLYPRFIKYVEEWKAQHGWWPFRTNR